MHGRDQLIDRDRRTCIGVQTTTGPQRNLGERDAQRGHQLRHADRAVLVAVAVASLDRNLGCRRSLSRRRHDRSRRRPRGIDTTGITDAFAARTAIVARTLIGVVATHPIVTRLYVDAGSCRGVTLPGRAWQLARIVEDGALAVRRIADIDRTTVAVEVRASFDLRDTRPEVTRRRQ